MISSIFRPCDYLFITWSSKTHQNKNKIMFDWVYPILSSLILSVLFCFLSYESIFSPATNFFTNKSFGLITGFLQTMPGFYVAALAAIATFNNPDMDKKMQGSAPVDRNGYGMTRRRFLSQAFAYLTFLSICLFLLGMLYTYFYDVGFFASSLTIFLIAYFFACLVFFIFFIQMLLITCLCLYYLGNRIHVP